MNKMIERVTELLETTADRYESGEFAWTQHGLQDDERTFCSVGALSQVAEGVACYDVPEVQLAADAMNRHRDPLWFEKLGGGQRFICAESVLVNWNDTQGRTVSEVIEVMKGAAKDLRNQS